MNSNLFTAKNVIVQGITGGQGSFHASAMKAAGTNIVGGTSPNKAGQFVDGIPVYATVKDIAADHQIGISIIFVPAAFAKAAILEAINAKIPLIICITEGVPIHDMLQIKQRIAGEESVLIGPNCPGVLLPGMNKLGIIPNSMGLPGTVGIVSRSGTLTYEAMAGLTARGIGQKYVIGIGGDPIRGTGFIECLDLFQNDPDVTGIVMIGEIGGTDELIAAQHVKQHITKPVYGYIAGHHAPTGVQLGHAGAILGSDDESAKAKTKAFKAAGIVTKDSIVDLINAVR